MVAQAREQRRERPRGVTVVAGLSVVQGVWSLLVAGLIFMGGTAAPKPEVATAVMIAGSMSVVMGLVAGALAWGMWTLQRWAFLGGLIFEGLVLTLALCTLVTGGAVNLALLVMLVFSASILFTMLRSRTVREAFQPVAVEQRDETAELSAEE